MELGESFDLKSVLGGLSTTSKDKSISEKSMSEQTSSILRESLSDHIPGASSAGIPMAQETAPLVPLEVQIPPDLVEPYLCFQTLQRKLYTCGYVYLLESLNSAQDRQPIVGSAKKRDKSWIKCWVELYGTSIFLWKVPDDMCSNTLELQSAEAMVQRELTPSKESIDYIKSKIGPVVMETAGVVVQLAPLTYRPSMNLDDPALPPVPYTNFVALVPQDFDVYLFACPSSIRANAWAAALRLAQFEFSQICRYTTLRILNRSDFESVWTTLGVKRFETFHSYFQVRWEGECEVRFSTVTEWSTYYVVITSTAPKQEKEKEKKTLFGKKKYKEMSESGLHGRGHILFYKHKKDVKKGLFVMHVPLVYQCYLKLRIQSETGIPETEYSTTVWVEGTPFVPPFEIPEDKPKLEQKQLKKEWDDLLLHGFISLKELGQLQHVWEAQVYEGARPHPSFMEFNFQDFHQALCCCVALYGTFGLDSNLADFDKYLHREEIGLLPYMRPQVVDQQKLDDSIWGLLYLNVPDVAGLSMLASPPTLDEPLSAETRAKQEFTKIWLQKRIAKAKGFLTQWNGAILQADNGRRLFEVGEVDVKTRDFLQWLKAVQIMNPETAALAQKQALYTVQTLQEPGKVLEKQALSDSQSDEESEEEETEEEDAPSSDEGKSSETEVEKKNGGDKVPSTSEAESTLSEQKRPIATQHQDQNGDQESTAKTAEQPLRLPEQKPVLMPVPVLQPDGQWSWSYQQVNRQVYEETALRVGQTGGVQMPAESVPAVRVQPVVLPKPASDNDEEEEDESDGSESSEDSSESSISENSIEHSPMLKPNATLADAHRSMYAIPYLPSNSQFPFAQIDPTMIPGYSPTQQRNEEEEEDVLLIKPDSLLGQQKDTAPRGTGPFVSFSQEQLQEIKAKQGQGVRSSAMYGPNSLLALQEQKESISQIAPPKPGSQDGRRSSLSGQQRPMSMQPLGNRDSFQVPPAVVMQNQPFIARPAGPLLGKVDKEENKVRLQSGLLGVMEQRDKEKEFLKKNQGSAAHAQAQWHPQQPVPHMPYPMPPGMQMPMMMPQYNMQAMPYPMQYPMPPPPTQSSSQSDRRPSDSSMSSQSIRPAPPQFPQQQVSGYVPMMVPIGPDGMPMPMYSMYYPIPQVPMAHGISPMSPQPIHMPRMYGTQSESPRNSMYPRPPYPQPMGYPMMPGYAPSAVSDVDDGMSSERRYQLKEAWLKSEREKELARLNERRRELAGSPSLQQQVYWQRARSQSSASVEKQIPAKGASESGTESGTESS